MNIWPEIEHKTQNYKAGFVAVFREYEGRETGETDKYGRPVYVTMTSFARHFGIAHSTFQDWCNPPERKMVADTATIYEPPKIKGATLGTEAAARLVNRTRLSMVRSAIGDLQRVISVLRELDEDALDLDLRSLNRIADSLRSIVPEDRRIA